MEATQTIEPAVTAQAVPAPVDLPWVDGESDPPPLPILAIEPRHGPQPVHWSVAALTFATAVSIVFGSHQANPSRPRELLPVMIVTKAR